MFVLHVDLRLKPGAAPALEKTFHDVFRPAIAAQNGFSSVLLLRPRPHPDAYRLAIEFRDEPSQKKWVASPLHQEVWPQMEAHCAGYEVAAFDAVG